ncbi:4-hydroxythreonine-4-phosphate dehydrogenase PdxA, partial [Alphaproteobacteria bacterium]|nr:4-hydroxythreonine-4-phosphate dehydrogenase PdxA [Alphaproteobacteria bacterium]
YDYLLKNNLKIILIGDLIEISKYFFEIKFKTKIIELFDAQDHIHYSNKHIFVFNIGTYKIEKSNLILNQIKISNNLSKLYSCDLITMPIDKSIIKKENKFNGVTEFLSKINHKKTFMLMRGENFSIIPFTTHVKFKNILDNFNAKSFYRDLKKIIHIINLRKFNYNEIIILGINPHAGENGTLGDEENIINKVIIKINKEVRFIKIKGPKSADSAFKNINSRKLFISYYHDQALIPFKILNDQSINHTIGLSYNRFSPTHGTASDIMYKNKSNNISFLQCMLS